MKARPGLRGVLNLNGDVSANIRPGVGGLDVEIVTLNANAAARNLQMQGKALGDFTATAATSGGAVRYNVNSNFAGSSIRVNGESLLAGNHETTATAAISGLPIDRVLAIAGRTDLPVTGTLALNGQVGGTLQDPRGNVNLTVTKAAAYGEAFDRLQAVVNYTSQAIDVPQFRVDDGPSSVELTANFAHPANNLSEGSVRFHVQSNDIQVTRLHTLQQAKPGLDGVIRLAADGAATLRGKAAPLFSTLNANLSAERLGE